LAADWKLIFIGAPIRPPITGPSVVPTPVFTSPIANHPGITAYEVITPFKMPPSESPDVDKIPPGVVIVVPVDEEDVPPRRSLRSDESPDVDDVDELGDARLCSVVWIVGISCDSVDCTPPLVDEAADWALAVACAAEPAVLVVCGAAVNGVTFAVVAAELAA
jgi:hypothetical protein